MSNVVEFRAARSNYRQVHLTFTQESSGRLSYAVKAKGLRDEWNERTVLIRDSIEYRHPLNSTEDVIRALVLVLSEQLLPQDED